MNIKEIALKSFITGLCNTTGTMIALGLGWKLFLSNTNNLRLLKNKQVKLEEQLNEIDIDIDIYDIDDIDVIQNEENNRSFRHLFDKLM